MNPRHSDRLTWRQIAYIGLGFVLFAAMVWLPNGTILETLCIL